MVGSIGSYSSDIPQLQHLVPMHYIALHAPHCDAFCCIVEHSGCRILQHCQQIEGDSSIGQGGSLDIKALVALSSHIAPPGHLLGWQQEAQVFLMCIRLSLLLLELDQEDISFGALNP